MELISTIFHFENSILEKRHLKEPKIDGKLTEKHLFLRISGGFARKLESKLGREVGMGVFHGLR